MTNRFNDQVIWYKNFKMGTEIDIAGTFIYNGMKELEQMETLECESEIFSFLYHISVGIERLQKILLVILEKIDEANMCNFEQSLISHSYGELHQRIKQKCGMKFCSRDNSFLHVLTRFYNTCRYNRFNILGEFGMEKSIFIEYIQNNYKCEKDGFFNKSTCSKELKEFLGRVIGSISRKYYNKIYEQSKTQNIYTYELRSESKAEKVFLPEVRKNSLNEVIINEKVAFKEFIVFLVNTKKEDSFIRFLRKIEPLDLDIAFANQFIGDLCRGVISQELTSEIECIYEENSYSYDRIQMVDLIGDTCVRFEYSDIKECYDMLKSLVLGHFDCYEFAVEFSKKIKLLDDYEVTDILINALETCGNFITKKEKGEDVSKEFLTSIREVYDQFKKIL